MYSDRNDPLRRAGELSRIIVLQGCGVDYSNPAISVWSGSQHGQADGPDAGLDGQTIEGPVDGPEPKAAGAGQPELGPSPAMCLIGSAVA